MKSKIVRGIINGGVLAAVAALGITVYQLGTKPIAENPQEENSVQVEETGLEEELSDGENAEDAAAAGDGWQDAAQDEISDGETGDEAGLSGASEAGADGVTGSIRETAGSGTAENAAADADNGSGTMIGACLRRQVQIEAAQMALEIQQIMPEIHRQREQ